MSLKNRDGVLANHRDVPRQVHGNLPRINGADSSSTNHTRSPSMISIDILKYDSVFDDEFQVVELAYKFVWFKLQHLERLLQVVDVRRLICGERNLRLALIVQVLTLDHQRLALIFWKL